MKSLYLLFSVTALLLLTAFAWAKPPTLDSGGSLPTSILPGHTYTFQMLYRQPEGDAPKTLKMLVDAPNRQISVPAVPSGGDPTSSTGVSVTWQFTPDVSGQYQYHFEATSSTGGFARFPKDNGELEFESPNLISKWVILALGLVVALFFLPFVVYVATRSLNKRSDPAAAARVALLLGVLASYALFWYLFFSVYEVIGLAIAAVAALAVLIVLFSRRRVA